MSYSRGSHCVSREACVTTFGTARDKRSETRGDYGPPLRTPPLRGLITPTRRRHKSRLSFEALLVHTIAPNVTVQSTNQSTARCKPDTPFNQAGPSLRNNSVLGVYALRGCPFPFCFVPFDFSFQFPAREGAVSRPECPNDERRRWAIMSSELWRSVRRMRGFLLQSSAMPARTGVCAS